MERWETAGDDGRARRETAATDGLAGLGMTLVKRLMAGAGIEDAPSALF